jgi:heat shock protein HslJ
MQDRAAHHRYLRRCTELSLLLVLGCGSEAPADGASSARLTRAALDGMQFLLERSENLALVPGSKLTLSFREKELSFGANCNGHFGAYELRDGSLIIDGFASTTRACGPELEGQDQRIAAFFSSRPLIARNGDLLTFTGAEAVLTFIDREVADPDRPLVGTPWTVDTYIDGDFASNVVLPDDPTLAFGSDGKLRFYTACNAGEVDYVVTGRTLTFSNLGHHEAGCPGASAAEAERHVLAVLAPGTATFEIDAQRLTIRRDKLGLRGTRTSSESRSFSDPIETRLAMCDGRERAISDWLARYRGCETDSDCELSENEYGGCVAEFMCGFALNVNVDRQAFGREARQKISEYLESCSCARADCEEPNKTYCSPTTKLCEVAAVAP